MLEKEWKWDYHFDMKMLCCVFFPFILDIKFVGRTGRGHTGGIDFDYLD